MQFSSWRISGGESLVLRIFPRYFFDVCGLRPQKCRQLVDNFLVVLHEPTAPEEEEEEEEKEEEERRGGFSEQHGRTPRAAAALRLLYILFNTPLYLPHFPLGPRDI